MVIRLSPEEKLRASGTTLPAAVDIRLLLYRLRLSLVVVNSRQRRGSTAAMDLSMLGVRTGVVRYTSLQLSSSFQSP